MATATGPASSLGRRLPELAALRPVIGAEEQGAADVGQRARDRPTTAKRPAVALGPDVDHGRAGDGAVGAPQHEAVGAVGRPEEEGSPDIGQLAGRTAPGTDTDASHELRPQRRAV